MARLNGWRRLWIVVSGLWLTPFVVALSVWIGRGEAKGYTPPKMVPWQMTCTVAAVADAVRLKYRQEYQDLSDAQLRLNLLAKYFSPKSDTVNIEFWVPEGVDGTHFTNLSCADLSMIFNPEKKENQRVVFASLDLVYPSTWYKGYDLNSALTEETQQRVQRSNRERRNLLLLGGSFAVLPPAILYGLGSAVAWIRRGFKESRQSPSNSMKV